MLSIYKQDGVDVPLGDKFSQFSWQMCRDSFENSPFVSIFDLSRGLFRGPRAWEYKNLPAGSLSTGACDGIGSKPNVITAAKSQRYAARDLMAMCHEDLTRYGGVPLIFFNILDVTTLGESEDSETYSHFCTAITGLGEVASEQKTVVFTGETAELGICVGSDDPDAKTKFNWAGVSIGAYHPDRMILGDTLKAGQVVMALRETGFRSNGISSVRKALRIRYGDEWYNNAEALEDNAACAQPSTIYSQFLTAMNGWWTEHSDATPIKTHLVVHVTGGAIKSKLGEDRLFPLGLSAVLDDLWEPPEIIKKCAQWRNMSDRDCYEMWGCGIGALAVIDEKDVDSYVHQAATFGKEAKACGRIIATTGTKPTITINSKFSGEKIVF